MTDDLKTYGPSKWTFAPTDHGEWNAKIQRLALRLGVPPVEKNNLGTFRVTLGAGDREYDFVDLVNAFLDRVDAATKT
jgi:hypothetical protein